MTQTPIKIQDLTLKGDARTIPFSPFGYVIDVNGDVYALTEKWTHGIIAALLYPDVAKQHGFWPVQGDFDDLPVFRYQEFLGEHSEQLPLIRVATSQLGFGTTVSGTSRVTRNQVDALVATLAKMGHRAQDTLTGSEDDPTVAELIEELRQKVAQQEGQ